MFLWTALIVGIVGSMHCIGMCGPIAAVLPYQSESRWRTALNVLKYHAGRTLTYALLGGIIGLLGRGVFIAGWQRGFSIAAGVFLLLLAVFSIRIESRIVSLPGIRNLFTYVKTRMTLLLKKGSSQSMLTIGMLNGLLPCGLVYLAITGAVSTGSIWKSMAYMALFGTGTIPLLLTTSLAGALFSARIRNTLRRAVPVLLVAFAILLIFRGVNFHIPAGFSFWEALENQPMCH